MHIFNVWDNCHYKKTVLRPCFQNAAIGHKNAALRPFGLRPRFLRPRFIPRPKTCDYRPGRSKAARFEPRPKTRSYSCGRNAASEPFERTRLDLLSLSPVFKKRGFMRKTRPKKTQPEHPLFCSVLLSSKCKIIRIRIL